MKTLHAALLLIDFFNPLDFEGADRLAPRAVAAARASAVFRNRCHRRGIPVLFVNDNFGRWSGNFDELVSTCADKGGASGRMARLLAPAKGDISVLKPRHSAFFGTPLEFLLEDLRVTTLILTGIAADSCVLHTALDAHVRKFNVWVPVDCVAAQTTAWRNGALEQMKRVAKAWTGPSTADIGRGIECAMRNAAA